MYVTHNLLSAIKFAVYSEHCLNTSSRSIASLHRLLVLIYHVQIGHYSVVEASCMD